MEYSIPKTDESEKLKILMIAPQPWFQPRGTPFSVLHRIKALSLLGHEIHLVTYHVGQDVKIDNLHIHRAKPVPFIKNVKIGPSIPKIFLDIHLYFKTRELLKKYKFDYMHTHEEAAFFGLGMAKKYGLKHLYDMHSSLPQQLSNFKFTKSKSITAVFEKLESNTIENSQGVITICPELQTYVENHYPEQTSILIDNVADNSIVFPPEESKEAELRAKYKLDGKKVALYYGTFEAYQGIDMYMDAAKFAVDQMGKDIHFLMVGGNPQQVELYNNMAKERGIEAQFSFTGFVQPQEIPAFVSISDCLVTPRLKGNNSPLKIYSYLRSGKPIVATDHITHTQILDESVSVLADPNPQAFAKAMVEILNDPERASQITKAAAALAEEKYSYTEYLNKTKWIVEQVIKAE